MARKGYIVISTFPALHKDTGELIDINRETQDQIPELLSEAKIKEHVKSGALQPYDLDDGSPADVVKAAPTEGAKATTRGRRS